MKTRGLVMIPLAATLLALLTSGAPAIVAGQTPTPSPGKIPKHQERMKGMPGMGGMMGGPHQVLAMAYRDNLATFAHALRGQDTSLTTVNLDLARPAVAEMRRSFNQMVQHHQAQIATMGPHMDPAMSGRIQEMESHRVALGKHLAALESEVNASIPDRRKVSEHATAILKQCADMSALHADAEPHPMR